MLRPGSRSDRSTRTLSMPALAAGQSASDSSQKLLFKIRVVSLCGGVPVRPAVGGTSMSATAEPGFLSRSLAPSSDDDAKEEFFRAIGQAIANALLDQ